MTNDPYEPTPAQRETGMMTRNARACGVCGSGADRYHWGYQCQADPNHHGDPTMGLFTDTARLESPDPASDRDLKANGPMPDTAEFDRKIADAERRILAAKAGRNSVSKDYEALYEAERLVSWRQSVDALGTGHAERTACYIQNRRSVFVFKYHERMLFWKERHDFVTACVSLNLEWVVPAQSTERNF